MERRQNSESRRGRTGAFVPPLQGSDLLLHPTQGYGLGYFLARWGSRADEAQTEPWALEGAAKGGLTLT